MKPGTLQTRTAKWAFLHQFKDYIFGFSIAEASFRCKKCIGTITVLWLKEAPNFGKSALSALYGAARKRAFCRPVLRSRLFAPNQGIHFWVLHFRSFFLIWRIHWCNHGTMVKGSTEYLKICTIALTRRCIKTDTLQTRTVKWAICTKVRITFTGSPFP